MSTKSLYKNKKYPILNYNYISYLIINKKNFKNLLTKINYKYIYKT
jgi:hypothetical protein